MESMLNTDLVRTLRAQKNWSQEELAIASSLSHRTIQRVESSGHCSIETRRAIAVALDVDPEELDVIERQSTTKGMFDVCLGAVKTFAAILFLPLCMTIALLAFRNFQTSTVFEVIISNPGDVSVETFSVKLNQAATEVIELRNGHLIEVDYLPGLTPRVKALVFEQHSDGKRLVHSSSRTGPQFRPVTYVFCAGQSLRFVSPSDFGPPECRQT